MSEKTKKSKKKYITKKNMDNCPRCGDKYFDILGIGCCGKCFDKIKTQK